VPVSLQTLAIQLGIKEAIVPTGTVAGTTDRDFDLKKLKEVLDRCGIVLTERKPSTSVCALNVTPTNSTDLGEFVAKTIEDDLTRLLAPAASGTEGPSTICTQHWCLPMRC